MFRFKPLLPFAIGLIVIIGLCLRLYHISDNQFLFYDEGMYLGYNRAFLDLVANNPAHNPNEFAIILSLLFKTALTTAKALWFFLLNLRVFILGPQSWFFARWVSAACGLASVVLLYFWARRYSQQVALLSALLLLILPSHVFYSRLGMQESLSTLLFLSAIYLYMLPRAGWPFFVSVFLLACDYFTNYRLIIAPVFIALVECFNVFAPKGKIKWLKVFLYFVLFYTLVFIVGSLYGGVNNHVTSAWMFHQAQDAGGKFNPVNFISYPYDVFALEGFFFACLFWGNIFLVRQKQYVKLLPFAIVILQMLMFSFAAEKGARYLCVVLPFMAVAAAVFIDDCWQKYAASRAMVLTAVSLAVICMLCYSVSIALARTDYEDAVRFIVDRDPQAVIVSTQPLVEGLFLADDKRIVACPKDLYTLMSLYKQGAGYLVLDPQAYVSWTADGRRFSPPLYDFLQIALDDVQPIAVFPHLNKVLLNRFVLDHNEQIIDSLKFLSVARSKEYGKIRVYEMGPVVSALQRAHLEGVL